MPLDDLVMRGAKKAADITTRAGAEMLNDNEVTAKFKALGTTELQARRDLKNRLGPVLVRLLSEVDDATLRKLKGVDDVEALSILLLHGFSSKPLVTDRRVRMAIKGAQRFRAMVESAGGTISTTDAALLMKTTDSGIYKMIRRNKLLAFKQKGTWALPVGQFDLSTNKPIAYLGDLLGAFEPDVDHDSRVIFCLRDFEGTGRSPLALLAEGFPADILKASAATLFEHNSR